MKHTTRQSASGCTWKKNSPNQLLLVVEDMSTDWSTLTESVEPSSFAAAGDRLHVRPNSSLSTACLGDPRQHLTFLMFLMKELERLVKDSASKKRRAETIDFETCQNFRTLPDLAN